MEIKFEEGIVMILQQMILDEKHPDSRMAVLHSVGKKLAWRILNLATSLEKQSKQGFFSGAMANILNH
jgi:hypothetical protein